MIGLKRVVDAAGALASKRPNLAIDTDPQQHAAASPLMLVVRSFLR
jgi:hypothetical protein